MHIKKGDLKNMNHDLGFTLIELMVVVIVLGILSAVALPRFYNFRDESETSAIASVASALSSESADNYNVRTRNVNAGVAITDCTSVAGLLRAPGLPSDYSITAQSISPGQTVVCTLNGPSGKTGTFTALGIA